MNIDTERAKRVIRGVAKTTGKYTLKGLGKGVELTGRGAIKTVDALVRTQQVQTLATGAGIIAASVMIPSVGAGLVGTIGLKLLWDKAVKGNDKDVLDEMYDILRMGSNVTRDVSRRILSPTLHKMDRGMGDMGKNLQDKIDDMFR